MQKVQDDETLFTKGVILTTRDVVNAWIKNANPDNVSGLYTEPGSNTIVGGVLPKSGRKSSHGVSKFKGDAAANDSQALKASIERHRNNLLAGKYDEQAEIVALKHNIIVYGARDDTARVSECEERLHKLLHPAH